ncbi:hypothetical protein KSU66_19305 [Sporosarcina sp. G11-34]|nr:hypothetical protein [Sporosarcina sp. G11-34]
MCEIDTKDIITVLIAITALFLSVFNFFKDKRKSKNNFLRLVVIVKSLKREFSSLHFNHGMLNFIPGSETEKVYQTAFTEKSTIIDKKLSIIYELLMENHIISEKDITEVLENLNIIEEELFELMNYEIKDRNDMEIAKGFINPTYHCIEAVERIITEYEGK